MTICPILREPMSMYEYGVGMITKYELRLQCLFLVVAVVEFAFGSLFEGSAV